MTFRAFLAPRARSLIAGSLLVVLGSGCKHGRDDAEPSDVGSGSIEEPDDAAVDALEAGWFRGDAAEQDAGSSTRECERLSPSACAEDTLCDVRTARRIKDGVCAADVEPVGCISSDSWCGHVTTAAEDPNGDCWEFTNTCVPAGWSEGSCKPVYCN